jgi:uncharacterized protein YcbK (DUF882 family)
MACCCTGVHACLCREAEQVTQYEVTLTQLSEEAEEMQTPQEETTTTNTYLPEEESKDDAELDTGTFWLIPHAYDMNDTRSVVRVSSTYRSPIWFFFPDFLVQLLLGFVCCVS